MKIKYLFLMLFLAGCAATDQAKCDKASMDAYECQTKCQASGESLQQCGLLCSPYAMVKFYSCNF